MNTEKITLPIEYWNDKKTRIIQEQDKNGRKIEVRYFSFCQFVGLSTHYPSPLLYTHKNNTLIHPMIEKFMSLGRGTVYEKDMKYEIDLPLIYDKFISVPVFYFVYNVSNYYHFIYDTLPYLYSYFNEKKIHPDLKILTNCPDGKDDLYPFVWECFEMLGIKKSDVLFLNSNTIYDKVLIGSSLTHNNLSNHPPHNGVFQIIHRMNSNFVGPEKIYVSRRTWIHNNLDNIGTNYTERRRCINEDEMVDLFKSYGYEEIFCENMSMNEKIGTFKNAKYIAGPIGGGMCNVIFSDPSTKVISINSPLFFDINERFKYTMNHTKLTHFNDTEFIDCENEKIDGGHNALSISGGLNSPWKVNLNTLNEVLKNE